MRVAENHDKAVALFPTNIQAPAHQRRADAVVLELRQDGHRSERQGTTMFLSTNRFSGNRRPRRLPDNTASGSWGTKLYQSRAGNQTRRAYRKKDNSQNAWRRLQW